MGVQPIGDVLACAGVEEAIAASQAPQGKAPSRRRDGVAAHRVGLCQAGPPHDVAARTAATAYRATLVGRPAEERIAAHPRLPPGATRTEAAMLARCRTKAPLSGLTRVAVVLPQVVIPSVDEEGGPP